MISGIAQSVHLDDVAILEAEQRHSALGHWNVDRDPRSALRAARIRWEDPRDLQSLACCVWEEPSGGCNHVGERLARLGLINSGPEHGARHPHARFVDRDEDHISRLEPDVAARIAAQQIVVKIECRDRLAVALHLNPAQLGPLGHSTRGVQPREHGAK